MNLTDCPYPECFQDNPDPAIKSCPKCHQWLKRCTECGTPNRSFSNYCRFCGQRLMMPTDSWSGVRGNVQRMALNRFVIPHSPPDLRVKELANFNLSSQCRSLLFSDGYLLAASGDGIIKAVALSRLDKEPITFKTDGPIQVEPAIHQGTLYVGASRKDDPEKSSIYAYTLGQLLAPGAKDECRWNIQLKGKLQQGLLPFDNRLYLNISKNSQREVHVIDGISSNKPSGALCLHNGCRSSALAGDTSTKRVSFLSEKEGRLFVNVLNHEQNTSPEINSRPVKDSPSDFLDNTPVGAVGAKLYAIFGDKKELCRLDVSTGSFDIKITDKVRYFALAGMNTQVVINATGIFSTAENIQENLIQGESIVSGPVILKDRAVMVGMRDGKIRFYKLNNLAIQIDEVAFFSKDSVQILAAYKNIIAVGSDKGEIKVYELI